MWRLAGAAGGAVSMVRLSGADAGLVLPAGSVAWAVRVEVPSGRAAARVMWQLPAASMLQVPSVFAVVLATIVTVSWSKMSMRVWPWGAGSQVPVRPGWLKWVRPEPDGPVSCPAANAGAEGAFSTLSTATLISPWA